MSTCTLLLRFKPMLFHKHPSLQPNQYSSFQLSKTIHRSLSSTLLRCSNQERNEALWLREEQRWLREEQRWLREESRWHAETETLLRTISALQLQIQEFERQNPRGGKQKLGFYCGEEDVEFSSFSSTTESAVKSWQASLGAPEDGTMTTELLEILYTEDQIEYSGVVLKEDPKGTADPKENANGATFPSVTRISEIHHKKVEDKGNAEVDVSQHRVFLLGEIRWEDSSRLIGRNKANGGTKGKRPTKQCLCCRREGRLLCAECDGSGEPNINHSFWSG